MISVIIPAHNEERYIAGTIDSVRKQLPKNYEIIAVDDGSTDSTSAVARKKADIIVKLKKKSGPAKARNEGAKKASGDMLVFLDADTLLTPFVLGEIEAQKKDYMVGTCIIKPDSRKLKHRLVYFLKNRLLCPFGVSNGIIFMSKKTFEEYGPFNEKMKKREEGALLRTIKRHGRFVIIKEPVISSTRRFEKKGYIGIAYYWIREALNPGTEDYEVVR